MRGSKDQPAPIDNRRTRMRCVLLLTSALLLLVTGCTCGCTTDGPSRPPASAATVATGAAPPHTVATDAAGAGDTVGPAESAEVPVSAVEVTLLHIIDGDTIRVRMPDGSEERVRYIGIDAPEVADPGSPGEYLGEEAAAHNADLLACGPLRLQTDIDERDDFGRLLAYVWAGDVFVNERLVLDGYARAHDYPPNLARQDRLWEAHAKARQAGIGIWAD